MWVCGPVEVGTWGSPHVHRWGKPQAHKWGGPQVGKPTGPQMRNEMGRKSGRNRWRINPHPHRWGDVEMGASPDTQVGRPTDGEAHRCTSGEVGRPTTPHPHRRGRPQAHMLRSPGVEVGTCGSLRCCRRPHWLVRRGRISRSLLPGQTAHEEWGRQSGVWRSKE
jgi:hypothetical protein